MRDISLHSFWVGGEAFGGDDREDRPGAMLASALFFSGLIGTLAYLLI